MASESCPRCGEKAISDTGHCVFCGAAVRLAARPATMLRQGRAEKTFGYVAPGFLVVGILYLGLGVIGTFSLNQPMLGLLSLGLVAASHGIMLILKNEWVLSVTRVVCIFRLCVFGFVIALLAPYFLHFGLAGLLVGAAFALDLVSLIVMIRIVEDVVFD